MEQRANYFVKYRKWDDNYNRWIEDFSFISVYIKSSHYAWDIHDIILKELGLIPSEIEFIQINRL